jgi:hypothetical protein
MPKPYSQDFRDRVIQDLRDRVIDAVERGEMSRRAKNAHRTSPNAQAGRPFTQFVRFSIMPTRPGFRRRCFRFHSGGSCRYCNARPKPGGTDLLNRPAGSPFEARRLYRRVNQDSMGSRDSRDCGLPLRGGARRFGQSPIPSPFVRRMIRQFLSEAGVRLNGPTIW